MSELSPEERRNIYEEEKAKIESVQKEKIERQHKAREHLNKAKKIWMSCNSCDNLNHNRYVCHI